MLPLEQNVKRFIETIDNISYIFNAPAYKEIDSFAIDHVAISNDAGIGNKANNPLLALVVAHLRPEDSNLSCGSIINHRTIEQGQYNVWVYLLQLGYANHPGRVYWVRCADPVMNTLMNCTLDYFDLAS